MSTLDSKYADGICFKALFSKANTLIDGSWRVSFDVNITEIQEIIKLSQLLGYNLQIAVVPLPNNVVPLPNKNMAIAKKGAE